jgi:protein-S-isoprenylcysteine O-methyltransferase Ste14
MQEVWFFSLASLGLLWISITSLRHPGSHGFYRFFAWEAILGMFLLNLRSWFANPFVWYQVISWLLLILSLVPLITGIIMLRTVGKPTNELEATTKLVTKGIFKLIRHPLYASLLYLAWGIFFKSPSLLDGCLVFVATAFLYATARADEVECLAKFGKDYASYMKKTRMFIPFIL